jgi:tetratricopeptide (TPR) repeat protein
MMQTHFDVSSKVSDVKRWREIFKQQKVNNARQWLGAMARSQEAVSLLLSDYDNLLRALEACLNSPETFELAYNLVQALYRPAMGFADWERWLVYVRNALVLSRTYGRRSQQARLLEQAGDLLRFSGNLAETETHYRESLLFLEGVENSTTYIRVVSKLASIYVAQGKSYESIALCRRAIGVAKISRDRMGLAHILLTLAEAHMSLHEWNEGLMYAEEAYELFFQEKDHRLACEALLTIVGAKAQLGKWQESEQAASDLTTALLASQDERTLLSLKLNLGVLAYRQGEYHRAEALWQEALQLQSPIAYLENEASLYNNLGKVYTRLGEWRAAKEMLSHSLALFSRVGDSHNWANTMDNLADLYEAMGDKNACTETLLTAVAALESKSDLPSSQRLLAQMKERLLKLSLPHP